MEKPGKRKSKILASLPKAAQPVTFQLSPPLSPVRSRKGFPNPGVSIIPKEARRKPKNSSFEQREPASPKVSCIGQVKNRKKEKDMIKPKLVLHPAQKTTPISSAKELENKNPKLVLHPAQKTTTISSAKEPEKKKKKKKKKLDVMMKIFKGGKESDRVEVNVTDDRTAASVAAGRVPSLGQMKKLTSSRGGVLENFDWRICEGRGEEQVEKDIVPCSARKVLADSGSGRQVVAEPRKEVNLWTRRNRDSPIPLQT